MTFASAAFAGGGSTPPWDNTGTPPADPNSQAPYGSIVFYDTNGNVVTGGTNLSHLFDYAVATTGPDSGATKATLFFAAPNHSLPTSSWATSIQSASNTFPNSSAPNPIKGPGFTNPVDTLASTDANLSAALGGFTLDTTSGYANLIQVRLKDSGAGGAGSGSSYWSTDIAYNSGSSGVTVNGVSVAPGAWAQIYPNFTTTTVGLTANPPSPQTTPAPNVTLTANITPAPAGTVGGTVTFFDGTTVIASGVAVSGNSASTTWTSPSQATHSITAQFIPTGGTQVQGNTSPAQNYVVSAPATPTSTSVTGPASAAQYSAVTFTASETPVPSPDGGSFTINYAGTGTTSGSGQLGTATESAGTGSLSITQLTLPPGTYNITATYAPTSTSFSGSTSQPIPLTVTAPTCPGAPVQGASCTDTQNTQVTVDPGSLTITTPYTSTNPFVLPNMTLNAAATALQTSARFPNSGDPQIVVHSSLNGNPNWTVSVTDSDLSCASGACTTPVAGDFQKINGENEGLTGGASNTALPSASFPGTVAFTDNAAAFPPVSPTDAGSQGLKNGPHTFATSSGGGNGSVSLFGTLSLNAPTATQAGLYTGTITFTVG
jgi:hypothetical protein